MTGNIWIEVAAGVVAFAILRTIFRADKQHWEDSFGPGGYWEKTYQALGLSYEVGHYPRLLYVVDWVFSLAVPLAGVGGLAVAVLVATPAHLLSRHFIKKAEARYRDFNS